MQPAVQKLFGENYAFSIEEEKLINSCFKPLTAGRNEILLKEGVVAQHMYLVVKGCLRVFLSDEFGNESTRFLIFEGRIGTAFPSFILKQPSTAAIQSLGPSELLTLSYNDREKLMKVLPAIETQFRRGLELDYIDSIQRIEGLITMDAKTRYHELLAKNPHIVQKLPSRIVADYLGISQETLSRLKSKK